MKGRKIAVIIGALVSLSMLVLPASVSAVATHTLTTTPTTAAWGQTVYISLDTGGTNWTGHASCNVSDPNGNVRNLGPEDLIGDLKTHNYNNWSLIPDVPGVWSVSVTFYKISGSATILTHTATFTQERTMVSVARDLNIWTGLILYVFVGILLIALLLIVVVKVGDRSGKVK